MIHLIYVYFLVASILVGYQFGDQFNHDNPLWRVVRSVIWLPELLFSVIKVPFVKLWNLDVIQLGRVHLGFNIWKDHERVQEMLPALEKQMYPVWNKWRTGRYFISAVEKLKKMNKV